MKRAIRLHDTRTGQLQQLSPREPGRVGIYACGPTVYGPIHVGNARPFVVFSLLKRFLVHQGYQVTLVFNITDVNDKIYDAAATEGRHSDELAREMSDAYIADTDLLALDRPDFEPRASEAIGDIVALISQLIERGYAYAVDGDVYFSVRSYERYGELSHQSVDRMDQGEGGEGAQRKRDPVDFALWKAHKPTEDTSWEAPWGRGRPGWHIECSAMAQGLLGTGFEIHGGGTDLIFPHHENEAAQTLAATNEPLAQLWVHNGMVRTNNEKMAKSVGNVFVLREALAAYGRDAVLMYFCAGHYRQPIEFDDERLRQAAASVRRVTEAARRLVPGPSAPWSAPLRDRFLDALADDFNTVRALAAVFDWVGQANRAQRTVGSDDLREMLSLLGLANLLDADVAPAPAEVQELARRREEARAKRDWARADQLRDELADQGWEVRDRPEGPELLPTP